MPTVQVRDDLIGVSARRAAAMADITEDRLRRWERYGLVSPEIVQQVGSKTVRLYGFRQLVELLVVRQLEGIPKDVRALRRLMDDLRREYDSPWTELRFAHDHGELYWMHPDGSWAGDRNPGQSVLTGVIDLKVIEARVRESVRRDPATVGRVEKRRGVLGSKPVIAGTRTPVSAVREFLAAGYDEGDILEAYPHLTADDIAAVRSAS